MQNMQYEKTGLNYGEFSSLLAFLGASIWVDAAVIFGSVARGEDNYHSDLDLGIWVNEPVDLPLFKQYLQKYFEGYYFEILELPKKMSLCLYRKNLKKIDFFFVDKLDTLRRNYLGSMIPENKIEQSILLDKTGKVASYLKEISKVNSQNTDQPETASLIDKFLASFEHCSGMHAKSDAYRFYFHYNCALHPLFQLQYLAEGNQNFYYSPRFFENKVWGKNNMQAFYDLRGTLYLQEANKQKRNLLDLFYQTLSKLNSERLPTCKAFCEAVYERDYFWNFRDYNIHNTHLPAGKIFRSATLSRYDDFEKVNTLLGKKNITTIIDTRAEQEIKEVPYSNQVLKDKKYIHAPFDPWNQPEWFEKNYHHGSNREIAYRFFLMACQASFQKIIKGILQAEGAVLIHCFAGKDRTGLVIGALQMLLGGEEKLWVKDYMASGGDADQKMFHLLFQEVERHGGIEAFLKYQGIEEEEQKLLKEKLLVL